MSDFTSALYLGRPELPPGLPAGLALSTGQPAALAEADLASWVGQAVAGRQGLEAGVLAPSSLHLFWDVFRLVPRQGVVLLDEALYPVGRWGAERALLRGLPVVQFRTGDETQLRRLLHVYSQQGRIPWLVTDGWLMSAGRPAPLARYLDLLRPYPNAVLLVDDTQAFGVLGAGPTAAQPWGRGGGGSVAHAGLRGPQLLTITSLAKGLGVPVAVLAGSAARVAQFRQRSETRVHTSPASNVHAWLAAQALSRDAIRGEARRQRLLGNVRRFRQAMARAGWAPRGGWFPVQKLQLPHARASFDLYRGLLQHGIRTLLLANSARPTVPDVAFCLRADHTAAQLRHVSHCTREVLGLSAASSSVSLHLSYHEHYAKG
ncbi:MAG TPA: aminotransferase class I/II-fold pyridoxal phosphate-dependent enzyme [Hymenobacter sp.]|jgi:8-amino-7-oxononanoate synthase